MGSNRKGKCYKETNFTPTMPEFVIITEG